MYLECFRELCDQITIQVTNNVKCNTDFNELRLVNILKCGPTKGAASIRERPLFPSEHFTCGLYYWAAFKKGWPVLEELRYIFFARMLKHI